MGLFYPIYLKIKLLSLLFLLILKIRNHLSFFISTINIFVVLFFNYNKLVTELEIETTISDSLDCKDSKYCYQPAGHIVTGDLKIINGSRFRSIKSKGL